MIHLKLSISDNCKSKAIIGLAKYSKYTDIVVHDISGPRKRKYFCDLCDDEELCCLPIFTNKSTGYVTYKDKKGETKFLNNIMMFIKFETWALRGGGGGDTYMFLLSWLLFLYHGMDVY